MILELVGARMVAPYVGTSMYVWTAMIGVILGALSFGYWYGGRLADRQADDAGLMRILVVAAGAILLSVLAQRPLLEQITQTELDVRYLALVAALLLFAPAALVLGIVSPYVAKLRLSSLATAGSSIGRLYAAGTFGSIVGTFLAGYWLIAWFGNQLLGLLLVATLVLLSVAAYPHGWRWTRISLVIITLLLMSAPRVPGGAIVADVDSAFARYQVASARGGEAEIRYLLTDHQSVQSAHIMGQPDSLPLAYTRDFKAVTDVLQPDTVAVIGGGTFTFPSVIARQYPAMQVDVVEIDPLLGDIARDYFEYEARPNLRPIYIDGRVFLNRTDDASYDLMFLDAFSSLTPPYQLVTREAMQEAKRSLRPGGLVIANVIAAPHQDDPYFTALMSTYRAVFSEVRVHQVNRDHHLSAAQNLTVVLSDDQQAVEQASVPLGVALPVTARASLLSDDHAPVEQLIHR